MARNQQPDNDAELRLKFIGNPLKNIREKRGLTQKDVADALRYSSAQFVSNWERGISLPPLNILPRLAAVLSLSDKQCIDLFLKYQYAKLNLHRSELSDIFSRKR